jgi:hypothetical protein
MARMLKIGQYHVLIGLHWDELVAKVRAQAIKAAAAVAAKAADKPKFAVVHENLRRRFLGGFFGETKLPKHAVSGAAWFAEHEQRHAILIVDLDDGGNYWITYTDDGLAIDSDRVLSRDEAGELIDRILEGFERSGVQPRVYVAGATYPETRGLRRYTPRGAVLGMPDGGPPEGMEVLFSSPPTSKAVPKQVQGVSAATLFLVLGLMGFFAVAVAVKWGMDWWEAKEAADAEEAARLAAMRDPSADYPRIREERIQAAVAEAMRVHTATPSPVGVVNACLRAYAGMGGHVAGWKLDSLTCDPAVQGVAAVFVQEAEAPLTATVRALTERLSAVGAQTMVAGNGVQVTASWPMVRSPIREALQRDALPLQQGALTVVASRTHRSKRALAGTGVVIAEPKRVSMTYLDPELESQVDNPNRFVEVPAERGFQTADVTINGTVAWGLDDLALDLPYMSVKRIVLQPSESNIRWTLEAFYVAR